MISFKNNLTSKK